MSKAKSGLIDLSKLSDKRLKPIAERMAKVFELGLEKVAAHHVEPRKYPLPPGEHTLERVLKRLFDRLAPERRKRATVKLLPRFRANAEERRLKYGDLNKVDLRLPVSVVDQVNKLPIPKEFQITDKILQDIEKKIRDILIPDPDKPQGTEIAVALESRLISVKCVKDTIEPGADEMVIGGTAVETDVNNEVITTLTPLIDLGKFKTGDNLVFPSPNRKQFFLYDLTQGVFPKAFVTAFIMAEIDRNVLGEILVSISSALAALSGIGAIVSIATGNVPLAIITVSLGALSTIVLTIGAMLLDDIFNQVFFFPVVLASNAATFVNGEDITEPETFKFSSYGGTYEVVADYRLLTEV